MDCNLKDMVVISASNAAYAAQPEGHSQGGVICMVEKLVPSKG